MRITENDFAILTESYGWEIREHDGVTALYAPCYDCGSLEKVAEKDGDAWQYVLDEFGGGVLGERKTVREINTYTKIICEGCMPSYTYCEECGALVYNDEITRTARGDYVCDGCINDYYFRCDECGEWFRDDDDDRIATADGSMFCCFDHARDAGYSICDECGEWYADRFMVWHDDEYLCPDCAPETNRLIESYHTHGYRQFYATDGKTIGIELEIERRGTVSNETAAKAVSDMLNENGTYKNGERVYFERDGSLNDGFEIITQPHDRASMERLDLESMCEYLKKNGFRSHDTSTCGLHVHVSRSFFENQTALANMCAFYCENFAFFLKLSRRKGDTAERWAKRDSFSGNSKKDIVGLYMHKLNSADRYRAVNLCKPPTVEFRLARGTLNAETLRAWIDIHVTIAENANSVPLACYDLQTWLNGIKDETKRHIYNVTGTLIF